MTEPHHEIGSVVGDARKRLLADSFVDGRIDYSVIRDAHRDVVRELQADIDELRQRAPIRRTVANFDEQHAHEDVDWNLVRGED